MEMAQPGEEMPAAVPGSLCVRKKDRSYKRKEIKKMPPPCLGSPTDSFLTPQLRPQPHTDPGGWACMAWSGQGQACQRCKDQSGGWDSGPREPGPRTAAAPP